MIIRLLLLLIPVLLGATWIVYHPGIVIIEFSNYVMQMSTVIAVLVFLILYCVLRFFLWLLWLPKHIQNRKRLARYKKVYVKAENQLKNANSGYVRSIPDKINSKFSLIESMLTILFAFPKDMMDHPLIHQAILNEPNYEVLIRWFVAQGYLSQSQHSKALEMLEAAHRLDYDHPWIINDLIRVYAELGQWELLYRCINENYRKLPRKLIDNHYEDACWHQLNLLISNRDLFLEVWFSMPRSYQRKERFEVLLIETYYTNSDFDLAEKVILQLFKKQFNAEVMRIYLAIKEPSQDLLTFMVKLHQRFTDNSVIIKNIINISITIKSFETAIEFTDLLVKCDPTMAHLVKALGVYRDHAPEKTKSIIQQLATFSKEV